MTEMPVVHKTPVSYSKDEIRRLRNMMSADTLLECPRCGEMLIDVSEIDSPSNQVGLFVMNCHSCNRMAFLPEEKFENRGAF